MSEHLERADLMAELRSLQQQWEDSTVPRMVEQLLQINLTIQQLKILTILATDEHGSTGAYLSERLGVSLASISGILDRLEALDMIIRMEDPHDRRVRRLHATARGRASIQELLTQQPRLFEEAIERIPLADLRALNQGMRAVLRASAPEDE